MSAALPNRWIRRLAQTQEGETLTAVMMLFYSFLAMASYNILKPLTRSKFIESLGADNIPYVQLAAGFLIGIIMIGYSGLIGRLPKRWGLPITQGLIVVVVAAFWFFFQTGQAWVSVGFYLLGLILGILLISQFWTLANVVYNARQAKRLFGFIGAGASLGGFAGSLITVLWPKEQQSLLLLVSAAGLILCMSLTILVIRREHTTELVVKEEERGVGARKALQLLLGSRHLQIIAMVISFAAVGANIIDMQLNLALEPLKKDPGAIGVFLAVVQTWMSLAGFVLQIALTSRIHRFFGIGFALMILPFTLGTTGLIMLLNAALWAPAMARVCDQSLRYTIDKTTREILFMPLPTNIKMQAKPFVDVTVDRFAKGLSAVLVLLMVKPWGFNWTWQQMSYASLTVTILWIFMAVLAKRGYVTAFRRSIENRSVKPSEIRLAGADLSTIETLIGELGSNDDRRVLYAIDILESLEKRNLVTPLLLHHASPAVRIRTLTLLESAPPELAQGWLPSVRQLLGDPDPEVRASAVGALARIQDVQVIEWIRPYVKDSNPRIVMTAAMVMARSGCPGDMDSAEDVLNRLIADPQASSPEVRKDLAMVLRSIPDPRFRRLLIPLLSDSNSEVAQEALRSIRQLGPSDFMFVPSLVSLLCRPRMREGVQDLLSSYGEDVLDVLGHFLRDPDENPAVRHHIPATLAMIPAQKTVDLLIGTLSDPDAALRHRACLALESLRRRADLRFDGQLLQEHILREVASASECDRLCRELFGGGIPTRGRMLARALKEKSGRSLERIFSLLGLTHDWKGIAGVRWTLGQSDPSARARALEYLDNILTGSLRKQLLPHLDSITLGTAKRNATAPGLEKNGHHAVLRQLLANSDPVIAASAVYYLWESRMTGMAGDLEQMTAQGDGRDWRVLEVAAWALEALRQPEGQPPSLWMEPLPTAEIAARMERLPLFAGVPIEELFRMAGSGRQLRLETGHLAMTENIVPETLHCLISGGAHRHSVSGDDLDLKAPAAFGFPEILEGRAAAYSIRITKPGVSLALSGQEFQELLMDSPELVRGLFLMLCERDPSQIGELVLRGHEPPNSDDASPFGRVMVLQRIPLFAKISRDQMIALAAAMEELQVKEGEALIGEMDPPAFLVPISGALRLESTGDEPALEAGGGDAVGLYQMLAGIPLVRKGVCTRPGHILRLEREDFFELLGRRPDLLRQLLTVLFRSNAN